MATRVDTLQLPTILPSTPAQVAKLIPMSLRPEEVRVHVWRRATALQALLNRLDDLRDQIIAELDAIDGDADLEPQCEDEGAEHDGREPDTDNEPGDPIMGAG